MAFWANFLISLIAFGAFFLKVPSMQAFMEVDGVLSGDNLLLSSFP
ncbi:hypothetical protein OIU77_028504 [Salix suchowensis]|uniref:Uncharacterized protein n=1 Tax=Salix suchowensis TaxID=1278906 RepID=A0ABQ9BHP2_9ROSI|nr:hypothetical protein OIU77_028504 [Salix suchowensis]